MTQRIFDKTEKGREEIGTRKYHLPTRLRSLLVMVDGKQSDEELLKKVGGLGLTAESLSELLANGFIQLVTMSQPTPTPQIPAQTAAAQEVRPLPFAPTDVSSQFQAIYQFYTETIKSTIGLRGYSLQLKVEKAGSIDEFRALRNPYVEAVEKAKGNEMARSLGARLDQLLYAGDAAANSTIIGLNDAAVAE